MNQHDDNNKDQVILSQRECIQALKVKVAGLESDLRDAQQNIGDAALIGHMRGADQATDKGKVERDALRARVAALEELIQDSAQHDSWRCTEYQECHCGLDEATDELGIPRIPYPPKIRA